jgi:hypothetical protein
MIFGDLLWGGVFNPRKDDGLPNHNIEIHVIVGHKEILSHEAIGWDLKGIQPESDRFGEKINSPSESGMSGGRVRRRWKYQNVNSSPKA